MARAEVPADVRSFLSDTIGSYEHLEVLLLMCADSELSWTAQVVAERLSLPSDVVLDALEHLRRHCLLGVQESGDEGAFSYAPATPQLGALVESLVRVYRSNRLSVVELMSALAIERVRNQAVQLFADAFVLGRKRGKDG